MSKASKLAIIVSEGKDLGHEWTDDVAQAAGVTWWEAFLAQYFYPKLMWLEILDGARRTQVHKINEAEARKIVEEDTVGFLEEPKQSSAFEHLESRDVAPLFRKR